MRRRKVVDLAMVREATEELRRIKREDPEVRGPSSEDIRRNWEGTDMKDEKQEAQFVVRLSTALADRVDAYAERLRAEQPGPAWKRSDVVRLLLARALDAADAEKAPKTRKRPPSR